MPDSNTIMIDDEIANMPDKQFNVAFERAEKEFGGCVADYESEEFVEELNSQLKTLTATSLLEEWAEQGEIVPIEVRDDGYTVYGKADTDGATAKGVEAV